MDATSTGDDLRIEIEAIDVATLKPWLAGDRPHSELCAVYPSFVDEDDARAFLEQVRRGLADVDAGRVYTTEDMMRRLEERRRARRAAA